MPRLLHLADLHLGWTPRGLPADVAAAVRRRRDGRLAQAVDVAIAERVDLVVIAGDLFDTHRPPPELVALALRELRRLEAAGVALLTVPGNHDELTYARSVYRETDGRWPGVLVTRPDPGPVAAWTFGEERVEAISLAYVGGVTPVGGPLRSFPRAAGDAFAIAAFHGTLRSGGARPEGPLAGERSLPLDADALGAAGYDYVALGHLHAPQRRSLAGGGLAVYPGCVGGRGPWDPGTDRWTLVEGRRGAVRVREVAARVEPVGSRAVDVGAFDDHDALARHVRGLASAPGAWMRVTLQGAAAFDVSLEPLRAAVADAFTWLELEDASLRLPDALVDAWAEQPTVRGAFVRRLRDRRAAATTDRERALAERALRLGLDAWAGDA